MKYLKKIFENSKIEALIDAVEEYNKVLKQDNIWKNYLNNIKDIKSLSIEELEEVLKFADDRWEEIKKEFEENIQEVKDIYLSYLEDCKSISDYSIKRLSKSYYNEKTNESEWVDLIELKLIFSEKTIKERKRSGSSIKAEHSPFAPVFKITSDEVFDYWKNIYDFFSVLKSNGYEPSIKYYQVDGVEMIILINMK
jgi:hypothetical protein